MSWLRKNWFLLGLLGAVGLAFAAPGPGSEDGLLHTRVTTRLAVVVIFLVQGMTLASEAIREGLARIRLHVVVQAFTYLVIPLVALALDRLLGHLLAPELRLGFLFLAVLPTTISTAIVFTSLAGGNAAAALVNATISNVLGVFVTPLWVGFLLEARGEAIPVWPMIRELVLLILVPLAVGQVLRPLLRAHIDARKPAAGVLNSALVLFIVYAAFCKSVDSGVWTRHGPAPLVGALAGSILLFAIVMALTVLAARVFRLTEADRIAALFCAPQKTLAAGAPMAQLIFGAHPGLGLIMLPVMIYHPVQLLVGGFLVNRLKGRSEP